MILYKKIVSSENLDILKVFIGWKFAWFYLVSFKEKKNYIHVFDFHFQLTERNGQYWMFHIRVQCLV